MTMNKELAERLKAQRVLCAVSGGADSMCMLNILREAGIEIAAAHYEHGIRGAEAQRDADFVEDYCKENDIPCVIGHGDVPGYAKANGLGLEEAARKMRYEFLEEAAEKLNCDVIATAHNADDSAETMIFNLTRGTGTAGLRGIPAERGNIIRPILDMTRYEIEKYLAERDIPHVEDSSNAVDDYSRNLIRHRVMPVLREINPAFSTAAARTAKLMQQDEDCLSSLAEEFLKKYFDGESLPLDKLNALHPAIAARVIRKLAAASLNMEHVEKALELARSTERSQLDIPGQRLSFERGRMWLHGGECAEIRERKLTVGETMEIPEAGIRIYSEITGYEKEINDLFKTYFFKCENISGDIVVTGRRPGDKYRPRGRGCTKTLKSLFAERRCTTAQKNLSPVLRDENGILAVYGFAPDERTAAKPGDRVIKISFERI